MKRITLKDAKKLKFCRDTRIILNELEYVLARRDMTCATVRQLRTVAEDWHDRYVLSSSFAGSYDWTWEVDYVAVVSQLLTDDEIRSIYGKQVSLEQIRKGEAYFCRPEGMTFPALVDEIEHVLMRRYGYKNV